jgi:hypothetical protein
MKICEYNTRPLILDLDKTLKLLTLKGKLQRNEVYNLDLKI